MESGTFYPNSGGDDGHCNSSGLSFTTDWDGELLGYYSEEAAHFYTFFRFVNITIPKEATIKSAFIRFTSFNSLSTTTVNLNCYFNNVDNAAAPSAGIDITGASLTSAVAWNGLGAWADGSQYDTPDLSSILQTVVDRANWQSGNAVLAQIRSNGASAYRAPSTYNYLSGAERAELHVEWASTYENTSTDGTKIGDSASADFKNRGEISDGAGIGDAVEGYDFKGDLADAAGVGDAIAAESEIDAATSDAAGVADAVDAFSLSDAFDFAVEIGDEIDAGFERVGDFEDAAGIGDAADALNWTEWVRTYRDSAVARFYCTLTGAADGLADIELPISSFQARKRQGESNFLSVIVPGMAYAEAVAARSNGELYIEMAYLVNGEATIREEIIRVEDLEINIYEGASSRSINLSGYREATYVAKNASISGSNYKYTMSGRRGFRFPQPDPYLNPGDTLTIEDTDDELTVDQISYVIAARGLKQMEVRE